MKATFMSGRFMKATMLPSDASMVAFVNIGGFRSTEGRAAAGPGQG
jgi:hypothetical protein